MNRCLFALPLFVLLPVAAARSAPTHDGASAGGTLLPELETYVELRVAEFDAIPAERKELLAGLTAYMQRCREEAKPIRLTFICTHNSRRSHLAQVWGAVAAQHCGIENVETFSGGTEATAFNRRAVDAVRRAGLDVQASDPADASNPRYAVRIGPKSDPMICFSKVYDQSPNPTETFCAVMTCTQADQACPLVAGAALRLAIPYEDPKVADGTPAEAAKYDERCAQIAREMLYAFSQVK